MDLCEEHPRIQVEFEIAVVSYVILLVHEIGDELEVLACLVAGVVAEDGELGIGQHLHSDVETFRVERIMIMNFVAFMRVLHITVDDVS